MSVLIEITPQSLPIILDMAYATPNNITGKPIYKAARCFLRPKAAQCLAQTAHHAWDLGYQLVIFDGYRPQFAQEALWACAPDPDFVTPPTKGSPHTRGIAVDLTLADKKGNYLDMGTEFDDFSPRAYHDHQDLSPEIRRHRALLLGMMTANGWDFYSKEWWHYQLFDSKSYSLITDNILKTPLS